MSGVDVEQCFAVVFLGEFTELFQVSLRPLLRKVFKLSSVYIYTHTYAHIYVYIYLYLSPYIKCNLCSSLPYRNEGSILNVNILDNLD